MALQDRELSDVNQSGELDSIKLNGTGSPNDLLIRSVIDGLISAGLVDANDYTDGKLGDWSFNSNEFLYQLTKMMSASIVPGVIGQVDLWSGNVNVSLRDSSIDPTQNRIIVNNNSPTPSYFDLFGNQATLGIDGGLRIEITPTGILGRGLTISIIDSATGQALISKEWSLANHFLKTAFVDAFTGLASEPIKTALDGKIDSSLLPPQASPQGTFTPTGGDEYPPTAGMVAGDYWVVDNVGAGYTFVAGDLAGQTIYESGWMQWDTNENWILNNNYQGAQQSAWGSIIGTLSDQTDLDNALALKADITYVDTGLTSKADQSSLDATNVNVSNNASDITVLEGRVAGFIAEDTVTSVGALNAKVNTLIAAMKSAGLMATS